MSDTETVQGPSAPNRVIPVLAGLALILVWLLDFGTIQPNRIVPGTGHSLLSAVGWAGAGLVNLVLVAAFLLCVLPVRRRYLSLVALVGLSLAVMPLLLELFATRHLPDGSPYARSSIGAGFWCLLFLLALMLVEILGRLKARRGLQLLLLVGICGSWLALLRGDGLESLSLVREFNARPDQFEQALWMHLALAFGAVSFSAGLAFALALKMIRSPGWQRPILGAVSFLQTIPSLAVFGLLIAPSVPWQPRFRFCRNWGFEGLAGRRRCWR